MISSGERLRNIIIVFLVIVKIVFCQDIIIIWQRVFDTGGSDYANDVTTDSKNDVIVAGTSDLYKNPPKSIIIKYSKEGDTIWTKRCDIYAQSMVTDSHDDVVIGGEMWDNDPNIKIIKCDCSGKILWSNLTYYLYRDYASLYIIRNGGNRECITLTIPGILISCVFW